MFRNNFLKFFTIFMVLLFALSSVLYADNKPLVGEFTINADGGRVMFSKGNEYYEDSSFYSSTNQYDYRTWEWNPSVRDGIYSSISTPKGSVGLFYWSDVEAVTVSEFYNDYFRSTDDDFYYAKNFYSWRVLTLDEWDYILIKREAALRKRGLATVASIKGLILIPDNWDFDCLVPFDPTMNSWTVNDYTLEQWKEMEDAGAVFLPAVGYRTESNLFELGDAGYYWSSTSSLGNRDRAGALSFSLRNIRLDYRQRDSAIAVRLVTDVDAIITYDLDGGVLSEENRERYNSNNPFTLNNPTREGYIFTGWTGSNGDVPELDVIVPVESKKRLHYKANWGLDKESFGTFRVSSTGEKVKFSGGNLYHNGSFLTFEENQYDFRTWDGQAAVLKGIDTTTPSSNVGLFYWSKDVNKAIAQEFDSSEKSIYDSFFISSNDETAWYVLSQNEWDYILNIRAGNGNKKGLATINTGYTVVSGLLLLPDTWILPAGCEFTAGTETDYIINNYNLAQWKEMEQAGAVFLPASGYRNGSAVYHVSNYGYYWSSSPDLSDSESAYDVYFVNNTSYVLNTYRYGAQSIRLVTKV